MSGDLLIRTVEQADLPALLELYRDLNPSDPPLAPEDATSIWRQLSAYPGSAVLVGVRQHVLVTSCTLVVVPNLTRGGLPYALIENVVTVANHRKQGHGGAVLKHAIAEAWKHKCYKVMLLTGSKSPATLKFYTGVGFEQNKTGFQIRQLPVRED
ncbi:GNAT family N-acetyltransferase [Bradyrhizobium sp. AUGA SZCCT0169]|uniref:GNAT family N-acetyltransferase n=1 Tax=Bradyrhizobium sp. AUGA SZCCT0169 TaxID=2807663 RepID=UPI001BA96BDD|nr:GNAT family N-acetyltransferase [Bradyrhizobium sp. AUGA SZCCT0169]MBR1246787.1 GNAT family N-acetyltransferase [Bradyrhizobium sp. AUGA SZCCT0169]